MKKILLLVTAALVVWLIVELVLIEQSQPTTLERKLLHLSDNGSGESIKLDVEIADEAEERQQGLMFRESLDQDAGMFFVFEEPQDLAFWMRNTLIPLDILYFGADGRFVSRTTMIPCTEDPCATYPSTGPAQYALEVTAGNSLVADVGSGWTVTIK